MSTSNFGSLEAVSNSLDILGPISLDSRPPNNHITTSVAGGALFLMKPVKMRRIVPSAFLAQLFSAVHSVCVLAHVMPGFSR